MKKLNDENIEFQKLDNIVEEYIQKANVDNGEQIFKYLLEESIHDIYTP